MSRATNLMAVLCVALLAGGLTPAAFAQGSMGTLTMKVSVVPTEMPADGGTYAAIFIQLASANGQVVAAPQNYQVLLTSANVQVATVQTVLVIQKGQTFGVAAVATTMQPGASNVTLAATGLSPASVIVNTYALGGPPAKLVTFLAPPVLFSDSSSSYFFFAQIQDAKGTLTTAATDLNVAVTSSDPAVVNLQTILTIAAGQTDASTNFIAGGVNGSSTITTQQNGLVSSSVTVKSNFFPLAVSLGSNAGVSVASGSDVTFTVTALSAGIPLSGANVTWSADSPADVFTNGTLATDNNGAASGTFHFGEGGNVTVTATVSAAGYGHKSASLKLSVAARALAVTLIPDSIAINASQPSGVTALVTSGGRPVSGVQVTWSSSIGAFSPQVSSTGASGIATSTFSSPTNGNASITVQASAAGYTPAAGSTTITVGPVSTGGGGAGGGPLAFIPGPSVFGVPVVLVLILVLVVIVVVVVRRRRGRGLSAEEGGEEKEGPAEAMAGEDEE